MNNELTEQKFWEILGSMPDPSPIFYRLYYNDDGSPNCYTMEDLPGNYIEIDKQTYIDHRWNVRVVDNQLIVIPIAVLIDKLHPSDHGVCCDPRDVCIVVNESNRHIKWSRVTNETN
jgi:hypothetical protein